MKGNATLATVLVIFSTLALQQLPIAAAFKPTDIFAPGTLTPEWDNVVNRMWAQVGNGCNDDARVWWNMVFHDCGTFDRFKNTGGCDGSLQFETNRPENVGMRRTIDFYNDIISNQQPKPSMADTIVVGGLLGLVGCNGPVVPFTPGRCDASSANGEGLLPLGGHDLPTIMSMMARASLKPREVLVLVGAGHTMSAKKEGGAFPRGLDATPDKFDNKFFQEMKAGNHTAKLPSDVAMLNDLNLVKYTNVYSRDENAFRTQSVTAITKMINLVPRGRKSSRKSLVGSFDDDQKSSA